MSTIVTRSGKGSPLTHNEVDANFNNLNTDKIQSGSTVAALTITSATINGGAITGITDLAVADGGTGASSAPAAITNLRGWATTATAAGTTTLTNTSATQQNFTGSTTQTVVLPVTSTLALGWAFEIINNSTGAITVNSSGGNLVGTVIAGSTASIVCNLTSGTTAASWDFDIDGFATETGTGSVVRATSPALVTPALGTPASGTLTNCTFPTLNQNTTGSAATLTNGRTIAITGDLAYTSPSFNGSTNVTAAGTLATVNSNVGSFGSSSSIPVVTVNAKGLVTAVTTATVAGGQYFGTAAIKAIAYNSTSIAENITTTSGNNCLSVGPITIASGFSVSVASGQRWLVL